MLKYIIIFLIICILIFVEWMREIHTFKITKYQIFSNKLSGIKKERKIVFLSDLHSYTYGKNNEKLIRAIKNEKPDYIIVAGDMVVAKPGESINIACDCLKDLAAICDVYFANGNHEQRMKENTKMFGNSFIEFQRKLDESGVKTLPNKKAELTWDNIPVEIYGLEMPTSKYKKFQKQTFTKKEAEEFLGTPNHECYNIMIAHNPLFVDSYLEWGADLVLSGHFHGGVVRLPWLGGIITPDLSLFPKFSGEMTKVGDASVVVSKGIGIHTIKVRLFNPAEVVVMHINGTED